MAIVLQMNEYLCRIYPRRMDGHLFSWRYAVEYLILLKLHHLEIFEKQL